MSIEATVAPVQPEPSRARPNKRRWLVLVVALAVLAVCGTAAWSWRTHPDESFSGGYGMQTKRHVGQPMWTVLVHWNQLDEGVTIRAIEPEFGVNTSEATVEYILCELKRPVNKEGGYESFGYGMNANRVDQFCTNTRPATGADLRSIEDRREELLVGVTPTRPGRTEINTHRISFDAGWQRGTDEIDVNIRIVTPKAR